MTSVIPLPFQGDLIDYLKLSGREIAWLWRDGKAYIPVRPICDILGVSYSRQRKVLTEPNSEATVALWATVGADGKDREMLCLAFPDFLPWLMGISPNRVSEEARGSPCAGSAPRSSWCLPRTTTTGCSTRVGRRWRSCKAS